MPLLIHKWNEETGGTMGPRGQELYWPKNHPLSQSGRSIFGQPYILLVEWMGPGPDTMLESIAFFIWSWGESRVKWALHEAGLWVDVGCAGPVDQLNPEGP
jgi:hypothetical protein